MNIPTKYQEIFSNLSNEEKAEALQKGTDIFNNDKALFIGISNWTALYGFETAEYQSINFRTHKLNLEKFAELLEEKERIEELYRLILEGTLQVPGEAFNQENLKRDIDILSDLQKIVCGRIKQASELPKE